MGEAPVQEVSLWEEERRNKVLSEGESVLFAERD